MPACCRGGVVFKSAKHCVILETLKIVPSSTMHLIVRVGGIPKQANLGLLDKGCKKGLLSVGCYSI